MTPPRSPWLVAGLALALAAPVAAAPSAAAAAVPPAAPPPPIVAPGSTPQERQELAGLRDAAMSTDDRVAALRAVEQLKSMGDVAHLTLAATLRAVLLRDKSTVEECLRKIPVAGDDVRAAEAEVAPLRAAALAAVAKLPTPPTPAALSQARAEYTRLAAAARKLNDLYASRSAVVDAMRHRPHLLEVWRDSSPPGGVAPMDPARERSLSLAAEQGLGPVYWPIVKTLQARKYAAGDPPATNPQQAGLLRYRLVRQTEAYNRAMGPLADPAELQLVGQVNAYRDLLGVPPLELDVRLLQAARRHSKEMVELKFYSGASPTAATKDAPARMRAAGFDPAKAPWAEALARGPTAAAEAFWAMYDVPAYHRAMTNDAVVLAGVGKWNHHWTLVASANGRRVLQTPAEEQGDVQAQGPDVPPQTAAAATAASAVRRPTPDDDRTDPTKIKPANTGGAGQVPGIPGLPGLPGF